MRELESERERRWKAEEATKKLAERIQLIQSQGTFGKKFNKWLM